MTNPPPPHYNISTKTGCLSVKGKGNNTMKIQLAVNNCTVNVSTEEMNERIAKFLNSAKQILDEKTDLTTQEKALKFTSYTKSVLLDLLDTRKGDVNVSYTKETYPSINAQDYNIHAYSIALDVYIDVYITD